MDGTVLPRSHVLSVIWGALSVNEPKLFDGRIVPPMVDNEYVSRLGLRSGKHINSKRVEIRCLWETVEAQATWGNVERFVKFVHPDGTFGIGVVQRAL
jgi:hypothetical protein